METIKLTVIGVVLALIAIALTVGSCTLLASFIHNESLLLTVHGMVTGGIVLALMEACDKIAKWWVYGNRT